MTAGIRTVTVTPDGIVKLLQAITADDGVRFVLDGVPVTAALAGVRYDPETRQLELDLFDRWETDGPLDLLYARRVGNAGNASDWGAAVPLKIAPAPEPKRRTPFPLTRPAQ